MVLTTLFQLGAMNIHELGGAPTDSSVPVMDSSGESPAGAASRSWGSSIPPWRPFVPAASSAKNEWRTSFHVTFFL